MTFQCKSQGKKLQQKIAIRVCLLEPKVISLSRETIVQKQCQYVVLRNPDFTQSGRAGHNGINKPISSNFFTSL